MVHTLDEIYQFTLSNALATESHNAPIDFTLALTKCAYGSGEHHNYICQLKNFDQPFLLL